ncbi:hypothetical protein [Oceanobacter mangrovi]|uniref:hypothetical protein n=1 Tax=Oceanobacter mangrovi TaxID=2862510 RepID=UPI001C8E192D|nr:hypothetical protein [Oceanobacter mangrovi]
MKHLERLRCKDKYFDVVDGYKEIKTARIWHCKYKSLGILSKYENIKKLVIATYPDDDLEPIGELQALEHLRIIHLPKVRSLEPLGALMKLKYLSLETLPSWDSSGKVTIVDSLAPIGRLNIEKLQLFGVRPESKELSELENCKSLISGRFHKYPKKEIERFVLKMGINDDWIPDPVFEIEL